MFGLHHSATSAFSAPNPKRSGTGHQRGEAQASQLKEPKPRSLPQKQRPHSRVGPRPGLGSKKYVFLTHRQRIEGDPELFLLLFAWDVICVAGSEML